MTEAALHEARELLEDERYEEALELLEELEGDLASFLRAVALYELGELEAALDECVDGMQSEDWSEMRQLQALVYLSLAEPHKAVKSAERAVALEPEWPEAHHSLAVALTQLGRVREADASFAAATELEPEEYFQPCRLAAEEFDEAVEEALAALPTEFRRHLANVELAVEDVPDAELIREGSGFDDLGLYVGGSILAEDSGLPDRILLFQRNLENVSPDRASLIQEITDTVYHEVGHHMGLEEQDLPV